MNPSARGWIDKLLRNLFHNPDYANKTLDELYPGLRQVGFIYGSNLGVVNQYVDQSDLSAEECSKINLLIALNCVYKNANLKESFVKNLFRFYESINQYKSTLFSDLFGSKITSNTLERIIHRRVQIDTNFITKNFNYFVTNAFLFLDVLAYIRFIDEDHIDEHYLKKIEATIEAVSYKVLNSKSIKNQYDDSLLELIGSSLRYQDFKRIDYDEAISNIDNMAERKYFFDIGCMTAWSDHKMDETEILLLEELGNSLQLSAGQMNDAMEIVDRFYSSNRDNLMLLSSKNVVRNFYDNSSRMVNKLLSRNGKRLRKELNESKEVMRLITKSTVSDLSTEEQKQLQDQLLDIFKTIPSLAIFLLPGGALLLPLVVKFIPKLLPSAFDDNRIERENL